MDFIIALSKCVFESPGVLNAKAASLFKCVFSLVQVCVQKSRCVKCQSCLPVDLRSKIAFSHHCQVKYAPCPGVERRPRWGLHHSFCTRIRSDCFTKHLIALSKKKAVSYNCRCGAWLAEQVHSARCSLHPLITRIVEQTWRVFLLVEESSNMSRVM